ncbi:hypothetical protein GR702_11685 [Novosphingobium sp. FGD1]|uniref:Uncharacterized protein n=1 Tax=Novosphingobium silvae TaxID=2692619 RepID=A0A7X4K7Q7_9SPHN|nr:hypothetical protein [Novosphingobium silvae]MYL98425.1 hypothetical protein [Novosphingobium silvae]
MNPLDRDDVALLLSKDIATWGNVTSHKVLERCLRALADKIIDYAHLHYSAGQTTMADVKRWIEESAPTSSVLPGLPGSQ